MRETIIFEIFQEEDGGFTAECLTENIFTQGDTWEALKANINKDFISSDRVVRMFNFVS